MITWKKADGSFTLHTVVKYMVVYSGVWCWWFWFFFFSSLKEASMSSHTCSHQVNNLVNGTAKWSDPEVGITFHKLFLRSAFYPSVKE